MELFYDTNMKKVRQDVIDIYIRNNLANKDRHDILNITVSLNGTYSRRGSESSICVSVIIEMWTGRPVDYNVTVKCFSDECKKCNIWENNGNC